MGLTLSFFQRLRIFCAYCLPAFLACCVFSYSYYDRVVDVSRAINVSCEQGSHEECLRGAIKHCAKYATKKEPAEGVESNPLSVDEKICLYRKRFSEDSGYLGVFASSDISDEVTDEALVEPPAGAPKEPSVTLSFTTPNEESCPEGTPIAKCFISALQEDSTKALQSIFTTNVLTVVILTLLPYVLMAELLGKSDRLTLTYDQRLERARVNWWLKFLVALIISLGLVYVMNPLGRGASTFYQFFISVGLDNEDTLPIYIEAKHLGPVLAGFLGWYLHLIGYIFTKLIHHDVISARVYSLLFKKFLVTYGIALVISGSGLIEDPGATAFFMFLIGLFPLSAMSILIDAMGKFGGSDKTNSGNLSQLPGISRWQILRLEEEGVDSMVSLANMRQKTIKENLHVIENLVHFWVDVAQLYAVVGHEAYGEVKKHCITASEFVAMHARDELNILDEVVEVSSAAEVARLLEKTFGVKPVG